MLGTALGKGTLYHIGARLTFLVCGYGVHLFLARALGTELYGKAGVIIIILFLLRVLMITGPTQAVSKLTAENTERVGAVRRTALRIQVTVTGGAALIFYLLAEPFAKILNDPSLAPYFKIASLIIPLLAIYAVYQSSLSGVRRFGSHALMIALFSVVRLVSVVIFVLAGLKLYGVLFGFMIAPIMGILAGIYLSRGIDGGKTFDYKNILAFTAPLVLFSVCNALLMNLDLLFLKSITKNDTVVGYYTAASTLSKIPYNILSAFTFTLLPSISMALGGNDTELAGKYIRQTVRYLLVLAVPAAAIISFSAGGFIKMLYPSDFSSAGLSLSVLIWGQTFITFFSVLSSAVVGVGLPGRATLVSAVMVLLNILLNVTLIPKYAMTGAAIATAASGFAGLVLIYIFVTQSFGTPLKMLSGIRIIAGGLAAGVPLIFLETDGLLLIVFYLFLFALYGGILLLTGEFNKEDLEVILKMIRKKDPGKNES